MKLIKLKSWQGVHLVIYFLKICKKKIFLYCFLYEDSQNSISFRLHKIWSYHHSSLKRGLELLRAPGNRMLETAMSSLQPGAPNTNRLCSEWAHKLWSPASGSADALFSPPGQQCRAPTLAWSQKLKGAKEDPPPALPLKFLFTVPGLGVSHPQPLPHVAISFQPWPGVPHPVPHSMVMLSNRKQRGGSWKHADALCTTRALQTLCDLIWNICFI